MTGTFEQCFYGCACIAIEPDLELPHPRESRRVVALEKKLERVKEKY